MAVEEEDATKCIKAKGAEARQLDPERQKWQILEPPGDSNKSDNGSFYEDNGVRTVTRIRARRAKWMFPFSLTLPPPPLLPHDGPQLLPPSRKSREE